MIKKPTIVGHLFWSDNIFKLNRFSNAIQCMQYLIFYSLSIFSIS